MANREGRGNQPNNGRGGGRGGRGGLAVAAPRRAVAVEVAAARARSSPVSTVNSATMRAIRPYAASRGSTHPSRVHLARALPRR
jgi:hypothetical protein